MSTPEPGWYPDPQDGSRWRWWDGAAWTEHVSGGAEAAADGGPGAAPDTAPVTAVTAPSESGRDTESHAGPGSRPDASERPTAAMSPVVPDDTPRRGRRALVVAGIVLLLAGAGAAAWFLSPGRGDDPVPVAIEDDRDEETGADTSPAPSPTATPEDPGTVSVTSGPDDPDTADAGSADGGPTAPAWVVIVESLPHDEYDRSDAEARADGYRADGAPDVGVLDSSDYGSLNPGYWVVYSGVWGADEEDAAAAHCRSLRATVDNCYQRFLGDATLSLAESPFDAAVGHVRSRGYEPVDTTGFDMTRTLQVIVAEGASPGAGQMFAFFFVDGEPIGTDTAAPSASIGLEWQDAATVALAYGIYEPEDANCCPTGWQTVRYRWDGDRLSPLDAIPPDDPSVSGSRR